MLDALRIDLHDACRALRRSAGFASVAVLTIALGASANISAFQLIDALSLRPLPVAAPEALVELRLNDMTHARGTWLRTPAVSYPVWEALRRHAQPFNGMFAWADETIDIAATGPARRVNALWVSGDFFRVLGVEPRLGRLITATDDIRGCGMRGAVISHGFWQREFAGDPAAVGRTLTVGRHELTVLGVTPAGFFGVEVGRQFDVAMPICATATWSGSNARLDAGTVWWLTVMARRRAGITLPAVDAHLRAASPAIFASSLPETYPAASVGQYLAMEIVAADAAYGRSAVSARYAMSVIVLFLLSGSLLLIVCGNLAHLTLARLASRQRELVTRVALGASRLRMMQQIGLEHVLLAVAGGAAGMCLSSLVTPLLAGLMSTERAPVVLDLAPGRRTVLFVALLMIVTGAVTAAVPVWRASRVDAGGHLRGRGTTSPRARLSRVLVASQIALSVTLVAAALLFVRTLQVLETIDPGFERDGVAVVELTFSDAQQSNDAHAAGRQVFLERVLADARVASAAEVLILPLTGGNWNNRVWMDGADPGGATVVYRNMVGPGYFRTMHTRLVSGREFTAQDLATSFTVTAAAVVNEAFSAAFGLGDAALGRRFWIEATPFEPRRAYEIVGVVRNTKYRDLREEFRPTAFVPLSRAALSRPTGQFVLRSTTAPETLIDRVGTALGATQARYSLHSFAGVGEDSLVRERITAAVAAPFGALGLLLAALGLYGVTAYAIATRRVEISVRLSLGATARQVCTLMMREGAVAIVLGTIVGVLLAVALGRGAATLLFGVTPHDPAVLVGSALLLGSSASLATVMAARRATRIDPVQTLRGA